MFIVALMGLVFSAILSRLLKPKEFGVVASAYVLQRFGQFIDDLGVGQALVQNPN
ncbi:oligosaccharide flippase family protein [Deinococcus sp. AJ005]|uniref:oligosaccharide flippase family protein n=1 Tax=Deinococcus sp. AJ005 TaxID=2652443 RepID=UPI00125CA72A|nr:oligosaccharide flippase family protein [Deinococcus sp. AJ005]QFP77910.1 oligosaccharide flippase family protein [Deinococcus sp. AJ005]